MQHDYIQYTCVIVSNLESRNGLMAGKIAHSISGGTVSARAQLHTAFYKKCPYFNKA